MFIKLLTFEVDKFLQTLLRLELCQKIYLGPRKQRTEALLGLDNRNKISQIINDNLYLQYYFPSYLFYDPGPAFFYVLLVNDTFISWGSFF